MKSALQQQAAHTLSIEYPGQTLELAQVNAVELAEVLRGRMLTLEKEIQHAQYWLTQVTRDYHDAIHASNLFQKALDELDLQRGGVTDR